MLSLDMCLTLTFWTSVHHGEKGDQKMGKLIDWLKQLFGRGVEYIKIAATNQYLKIKDRAAELMSKYKVPRKHRQSDDKQPARSNLPENQQSGDDEDSDRTLPRRPKMTDEGMRAGRVNTLQNLHSEEVARRADRNINVRKDVLDHPGLIDADSEWEADLKLKLAQGEDISSEIESNPQLDMDSVMDQLGMEWAARAGKNSMGNQFIDTINGEAEPGPSAEPGEAASPGAGMDSGGASTDSGFTSAVHGGELSGTASVDVDTDAGTVSTTTGGVGSSTGSVSAVTSSSSGSTGTGSTGASGANGGGESGVSGIGGSISAATGTGSGGSGGSGSGGS